MRTDVKEQPHHNTAYLQQVGTSHDQCMPYPGQTVSYHFLPSSLMPSQPMRIYTTARLVRSDHDLAMKIRDWMEELSDADAWASWPACRSVACRCVACPSASGWWCSAPLSRSMLVASSGPASPASRICRATSWLAKMLVRDIKLRRIFLSLQQISLR
jgi:hypothetical protein